MFDLLKMLGLKRSVNALLEHQKPAMIALVASEINHVPDTLDLGQVKETVAVTAQNALMKCRSNNPLYNSLLPGLSFAVGVGVAALPEGVSVADYKRRALAFATGHILSARF